MPKSDVPDQLPLFDDDSAAGPVPSPQPWRTTPADAWSAEKLPSPSALEHTSPDLLRRNLEFLRAMELHARKVATVEVRRFRERHEELLRHLVRWRNDGDEEDGRAALAALGDLADLRLRALEKMDPGRLEKVMAAEPRVRVRDPEIERALSMAEFELAEARGELVGLEIPAPPDSTPLSGWLGPGEVGSREDGAPHGLRPELFEALNAAFPDGIVEPVWDESNLEAMEDDLRSKLAGLEGARLLYQRTLEGDEIWDLPEGFGPEDPGEGEAWEGEGEWEDGDEGGWHDPGRSYGLLFLSPGGEGFRFQIEGEFMEEDGALSPTTGVGEIGWAVAVSSVAPFALLRVRSLELEERFGASSPDIEPRYFDDAGVPAAAGDFFLDMLGPEERGLLDDLRRRITGVLQEFGVAVLGEDEAGHGVPWLDASDDVFAGQGQGALLTVENALFFRHL